MKRIFFLIIAAISIIDCSHRHGTSVNESIEGRNIVVGNGVVVSAQIQSSRVGVSILQKGGNAVDAAVATEFALAVCFPQAGNIGGGGFMVIRTSDGSTDVIDYREKAPLKAYRDMFLEPGGEVIGGMSTGTHLSSGVPGTVDGMLRVHSKYGKLPFREVIQPAIELAKKGFPVSRNQANSLNNNRELFLEKNNSKTTFIKDTEWKEGDILVQPDLAETLERIRDNGRDGFYSGKTAALIIKEMKRGNGIISQKDLDEYHSVFRKPLTTYYKGYKVISVPPPSAGGIILFQLLGMVEPYPLGKSGFHSVKTVHLIAEAERRAFADRAEYAGDPDFINTHAGGLVSREYLKGRFSDFNENMASPSGIIKAGSPEGFESEETTHYSVVDKFGNAVSATTTLNNLFGSGIVVEGAGFLLNNQMDDFSIKPGVPNLYGLSGGEANSVAPGKRMASSMTPAIVEKDGKLFLIVGSPGGSTIPTTVFQVIINVIDYNMNIREAVDTGRFHHQWLPDQISIEPNSIDSLAISYLKQMGHEIKTRQVIGSVNAVQVLKGGKMMSGADKRGDNTACGY